MKTRKLLSIFLALMMILSVVPIYASAAVETLSANNVTQWPTITYKTDDGVIHYGQTFSEAVIINDDEIVLDAEGNQVAGHFEFFTPAQRPSSTPETGSKLNIKFVPDDTAAYKGFTKVGSSIMYNVVKTTLLLVDSNNLPVTTSKVEKGGTLSNLEITGGQVYNPYYSGDTKAANAYWEWVNPDTVVTESGEFEATLHTAGGSYESMTRMVYVEVESSIEATTIVEAPTATLEYGQYWSELVLEGGKVMAGDTEVSGTFVLKSMGDTKADVIGVYDYIQVIFTPDDLEKYAPCEGTAVVTVTKANYKFVNENGEEVVPEFTMPYGTTFDPGLKLGVLLKNMIKDRSVLTGADVAYISFPDHDTDEVAPVGTNTYTVRIRPGNSDISNYNVTDIQFVLTIEPVVITTTAYWSLSDKIGGKVSHEAKGTFDVFVDGELVGDDIKITRNKDWSFDYPIPATGDYTLKVVYNPIENDPHSMEDYETVVNVRMIRQIILPEDSRVTYKVNGDERTSVMRLGDTIELSTFGGDLFRGWKITDANGNIVDLGVADLMANQITFTMPDHDLYIEAQYEKEVVDDNNGGLDIDNIFGDLDLDNLTQGDSDNPIENLFNNIIALFKNIIEKITAFFRGIGDRT
ncbi:MAG: hypothetical protein IJ349_07750 [Clostridia bacterium]|nr:hypothetical protein [Clostridia bacterium]